MREIKILGPTQAKDLCLQSTHCISPWVKTKERKVPLLKTMGIKYAVNNKYALISMGLT